MEFCPEGIFSSFEHDLNYQDVTVPSAKCLGQRPCAPSALA
jgi:hypothetical protein